MIFNSTSGVAPVTDGWFEEGRTVALYGLEVPIVPPTELVWSKLFVQDRHRYDGADVAHVVLKQSDQIDWRRLLGYAEQFWEVLLAHMINFRFIYPTERDCIPGWLIAELMGQGAGRVARAAHEGVPRSTFLARRLPDRHRRLGFRRHCRRRGQDG